MMMLKRKSDAFDAFKKFKEIVKEHKLGCLRIYQGGEFNSSELLEFF